MSDIHFGTDGWRAKIPDDFTADKVRQVADAAATLFLQEAKRLDIKDPEVLVGYDTRKNAQTFAELAAKQLASKGIVAKLSDSYIPTPALCWTVKNTENMVGGLMLTASHNPAEYLGIKIRMHDGGASPKAFTDELEKLIVDEISEPDGQIELVDVMTEYLDKLLSYVDLDAIKSAHIKVLHDAMYGASRHYLPELLTRAGVSVRTIHQEKNESFNNLHPEPIFPWIEEAKKELIKENLKLGLINDGDADRIGALDEEGNFVSPHKILTLIFLHLYKKGRRGRVVTTLSGSSILKRAAKDHDTECTIKPVGFKWIYEEMLKGDVICGGEESGGIGIPDHVFERDGLLMDLLLCEIVATEGKSIKELVDELEQNYGKFYYQRVDLAVSQEAIDKFKADIPQLSVDEIVGCKVESLTKVDGLYFEFADDAWLLMRPSGTEPLVRIYAESLDEKQKDALLEWGKSLVLGE